MSDTKQPSWAGGGKRAVHFGFFLRRMRETKNFSRAQLGKMVAGHLPGGAEKGFSDKRIFDIEKMPTPERIRERTFVAMGRALGWETREEFDAAWRSTPVEPYPETDERFAESAVSRLLGGQPALVTELQAAAVAEGITLPELFQRISREWLTAHGKNPGPFNGVHTDMDAIKQPPASARPPAASPASPGTPARARRGAKQAGRGGK